MKSKTNKTFLIFVVSSTIFEMNFNVYKVVQTNMTCLQISWLIISIKKIISKLNANNVYDTNVSKQQIINGAKVVAWWETMLQTRLLLFSCQPLFICGLRKWNPNSPSET